MRSKTDTTTEFLIGPKLGEEKPPLKFAPVDELSDSDEAEMDLSTDDEGASHPRKKRALDTGDGAPVPPPPKWSNPDPYTVLPPPDESRAKRVDVVKLIRKARVEAAQNKPAEGDAVADNEDFISFDSIEEAAGTKAPEGAPTGPKHDSQWKELKDAASASRKRTYDDEIKGYSKKIGRPLSRFYTDASILDEWRKRSDQSGTPWFDHTEPTLHLGTRLHNEIISFYNWVKPRPYEQIVRADLVSRLQSAFQNRYYGAQLKPFGSFASGLYLPTADIDLVLLSTNFMRTGTKTFGQRKGQIYAFAAFLKGLDIAVPNSIETIAHARVPILKFVDKLTGLRVDLSFDNDSGLLANDTFQCWKSEFPAMPLIVSIIKQFLLLRGLNEVPTGGLGGFSITCLVTSLLQHLPHGHAEPNLGGILMDFFDFYGHSLDYESVGIRMNPPGYFNKRVFRSLKENNNARLSIEDPNNPDNDISGGTREIPLILRSFSDAFFLLKERMTFTAMAELARGSLLGSILAANYDEYAHQRQQLREVFETHPRFAHYRQPPPPPPSLPEQPRPPPPPPSAPPVSAPPSRQNSKEKLSKLQRKQQASRERAARLRRLRPDIPSVPESITNEHCLTLGGYKSQSEMDRDLTAREKELQLAI